MRPVIRSMMVAASLVVTFIPAAHAATVCTTGNVKGSYGFTCQGTTGAGPVITVGRLDLDGAGNLSGHDGTSIAGVQSPSRTLGGIYVVQPHCGISVLISTAGFPDFHADGVIDDMRREFRLNQIDNGTTVACTARKQ